MNKLFKQITNSRGDTIVEVLIAIAIISLVLAGAYVSANRSAKATRTAQEHGEALKAAESQVELIKVAARTGAPDIFSAGDFCITGGTLGASCVTPPTGVEYTTIVIHASGSHDFVVRTTWDSITEGTNQNSVELDYRAQ